MRAAAGASVLLLLLLLQFCTADASDLVLSAAQKQETVDAHNRLRRSVYPPAANMNYLTWNTRLEELAQRAANRCVFEHNYGGDYAGLGENLYQGFRTNVTDIISFFFAERLAYDFSSASCNPGLASNVLNLQQCGHYQQVVAATISEVACAIASCGSNNLFVCEYSGGYGNPLYKQGEPCSACSVGRSFCYSGLCINGTMKNSIAQFSSATCSMQCKNCGSKVEFTTSSGEPRCVCSCKSGYQFSDCSTVSSTAVQLSCGMCERLNTLCQNGGQDTNSSDTCKCSCPSGYTGLRCQISTEVAANAAYLRLLSSLQFCSGGKCVPVPQDAGRFAGSVWPTLRTAVAAAVNAYCRQSDQNFAACCGGGSLPSGSGSSSFVADADVQYVSDSVTTDGAGNLMVAVYATPQASNALCSAASGRRRRKRAASTTVSLSVMQGSVTSGQSSITASMSSCCSVSVAQVSDYNSVVSAEMGNGQPPVAVNSALQLLLLLLLLLLLVRVPEFD